MSFFSFDNVYIYSNIYILFPCISNVTTRDTIIPILWKLEYAKLPLCRDIRISKDLLYIFRIFNYSREFKNFRSTLYEQKEHGKRGKKRKKSPE